MTRQGVKTMTASLIAASLSCLCLALAVATVPARYTRNGGMRFLRVGRIQLSFCLCRNMLSVKG